VDTGSTAYQVGYWATGAVLAVKGAVSLGAKVLGAGTVATTMEAGGQVALEAGASDVRYANGIGRSPIADTLDQALRYKADPEAYLNDLAERAGLNLRGIRIAYDPTIAAEGRTLASEGGWVIRVGPNGIRDDYTAVNTLAHELNHACDYINNDRFLPKPVGEPIAYAAGDAAEEWFRGLR